MTQFKIPAEPQGFSAPAQLEQHNDIRYNAVANWQSRSCMFGRIDSVELHVLFVAMQEDAPFSFSSTLDDIDMEPSGAQIQNVSRE